MIKTFYKEDNKWYIDLPLWVGPKSALQMVSGADELLDRYSNNTDNVSIKFSTKEFSAHDEVLIRVNKLSELDKGYSDFDGAIYKCQNNPIEHTIITTNNLWLCGVTLFVFLKYPKKIYLKKELYLPLYN